MSDSTLKLQVVIPAYNEAEGITDFINQLITKLEGIGLSPWNILVVDDGSSDATFEKVVSVGHQSVSCVRLSRNSGSHIALRAGLSQANAQYVLCLAADGQDDVDALDQMIEKIKKGAHVVWALRRSRQDEDVSYRFSTKIFYWILEKLVRRQGFSIDLNRADFFLLNNTMVKAINQCPERNTSLMGLMVWLGFEHDWVEYDRKPRTLGKSRWTKNARLRLALDWVLSFSGVPLKLITFTGFCFAFLGFLYTLLIFANRIMNDQIPSGWSSLMVAVMILGGVQMIMLGVVGEYLWRTFDETKRRPLYVIEKTSQESDGLNRS